MGPYDIILFGNGTWSFVNEIPEEDLDYIGDYQVVDADTPKWQELVAQL